MTGLEPASYQLIYYGAPGTGKSHGIEKVVGAYPDTVRTTFHPDSDYASFVGCYKPTMEADDYDTVVTTGEKLPGGTISKKDGLVRQKRIVYKFVPQAFTKAYVRAWKKMAEADAQERVPPQFLVIEEINRGNCAQIFGDLFQLLDRKGNGFSKYPIEADTDLAQYIAGQLTGLDADAQTRVPPEVLSGEKLILPPNLCIWATMNTSDQSLFPIDSAFKRRWEWKYVPIAEGKDKDGKPFGWKIKVADGEEYDWWSFLEKANAKVYSLTESEDKKLGYFFCKADKDGVISLEQFVGKVVFYLWNDVFKDYGFDDGESKDGNGGRLCFAAFFKPDGNPDPDSVRQLMKKFEIDKIVPASETGQSEAQAQ